MVFNTDLKLDASSIACVASVFVEFGSKELPFLALAPFSFRAGKTPNIPFLGVSFLLEVQFASKSHGNSPGYTGYA